MYSLKKKSTMEIKLKCSQYLIKPNYKEIVKNLFDFNIGTSLTELLKVETSIEMKSFLLLFNTTKRTFLELSKQINQKAIDKKESLITDKAILEIRLKRLLEEEIIIESDFFNSNTYSNPEYLNKTYEIFEEYCSILDIEVTTNLNYQYFYYFRANLEKEFHEYKEKYQEINHFFENPIIKSNTKFNKILDHYINIKELYTNPLQISVTECKETLKDLYIEPNFNIHKSNGYDHLNEYSFIETKDKEINIHDFINNFFLKGNKYDDCNEIYNMLFILGQPGQGKTSLCYRVVFDYLNSQSGLPKTPLFFIKIRDLIARNFIDNPFQTINEYLNQEINFRTESCILILDGLDESYMSGGLNDSDLRNLYDRLNKTSQQNKSLKIILTSRLNYLKLTDSCIDGSLIIQIKTLSNKQIENYSKKFKSFYPDNKFVNQIEKIISTDKYIHVLELLQQAVIIYFIAISDIDIDENDSKAKLYNKIFSSLAKRSWDKNGQLNYINKSLQTDYKRYEKLLREYIRLIAFEIHQSKNLYITLDKLQGLEATKKFIRECFDSQFSTNPEKLKEISKYLLVSFYFQESNTKSNETAIEFFHNSLWEYLTAEYFWEENKKFLLTTDNDGDLIHKSSEDYFYHLNKLVGNKPVEDIIKNNLETIILNEADEQKELIFKQSEHIFYDLLKNDFLLKYDYQNSELSSMEKSINIFNTFWTFLHLSNFNLNSKIITDSKLNNYLFNYSFSFYGSSRFKNIEFNDDFYFVKFISDNEFTNISFSKNLFQSMDISDNVFKNSTFVGLFSNTKFDNNKFIEVTFSECVIFNDTTFKDNSFVNYKFNKVKAITPNFLKKFKENNSFDKDFFENHSIKKIRRKQRDGISMFYYEIDQI